VNYDLVVIGASWGGLDALGFLLERLDPQVEQPIVIAQHRSAESTPGGFEALLQGHTNRTVVEAGDKDPIRQNHVHVAPPDYHLLVERGTFALSTEARVQYARPSIDVLFDSVAEEYGERAIGIVLTGANQDGARGLRRIKEAGGVALVQQPETAVRREMPDAAIAASQADAILALEEIPPFLRGLCCAPARERV
jgi:two-component system chemotaxis response regulator CheB